MATWPALMEGKAVACVMGAVKRSMEEAVYGPPCKECGERRTRNPSGVCFPCLDRGGRRCPVCRGSGVVRGIEGCPGACQGTGMIARVT